MVSNLLKNGQALIAKQQNSILSAAFVITLASLVSAVLGFIRERVLISYFFTNSKEALDAFRIASRLPELAFQILVVGALSAAFIPIFSKYLAKSKQEAYEISSSIINIVLLLFIVISAVIFINAEGFIRLITSVGFSDSQIVVAAKLTRVMLLAQFFFAISNFLTGMIQSHQRFLVPALAPLAHNLGIIIGIIAFKPIFGIYSAAIGIVLGSFLHLLFQLPLAIKLGFSYRLSLKLYHPGVKEMLRLIPARTLTISVNQLEYFATGYFATAMSVGSLTLFEIAQRLMSAPIRVFAVPIGQASLPFLSQETAADKRAEFKTMIIKSLHKIMFLTLPASIILIVLRIPLVRILYGAKSFPWSATLLTGQAVAVLSLSIFAQSAHHILSRAFYAMENTKTPFKIATLAMMINLTISYIATFILKSNIVGIAWALTISSILHVIVLLGALHRRTGGFDLPALLNPIGKMIITTLATGICLWVPMRLLDQFVFDTTKTIPLIILTVVVSSIGFIVYLLFSKLLGVAELAEFRALIGKLGNWQKALTPSAEVIQTDGPSQEVNPS